jgi:hypothetical protein
MLEISFLVLTLVCIWAIARPLLVASSDRANQESVGELQITEREDLERFLESLEFERARGLIGDSEFQKQQSKTRSRLEKITGNNA